MMTDRRPARGASRREYDTSYRQEKIRTPASPDLTPIFEALEAAGEAQTPKALKNVCKRFLTSLSSFYDIPAPSLKLLGPRPHSTREGHLANELFGD
jgi:hypothetical protein